MFILVLFTWTGAILMKKKAGDWKVRFFFFWVWGCSENVGDSDKEVV